MADYIELEERFLKELGNAMTRWQLVETETFTIYSRLMKGADKTLISVSFHHIQSFESKLQLVTRSIFFTKADATKSGWEPLRKRAEKLAGVRNELVHSSVSIMRGKDGSMAMTIGPSHLDATAIVKKRAMNDHYLHDAKKVAGHAQSFIDLYADMRKFADGADFTIATRAEREASAKSSSLKSKGRSA